MGSPVHVQGLESVAGGGSVSFTSGFHPKSNGQVERVTQDVGRVLRSYCQDRPGEAAAFIPWAEMAKNSLRHSSTNH